MDKILQFKKSLDYYLKQLDIRLNEKDYLGALDAGRNAINASKTRIDRQAINLILSQVYFEMGLHLLSCEYAFYAIENIHTRASAYLCIGKNLVLLKKPKRALLYLSKALEWCRSENIVGAVLEWTSEIKSQMLNQNVDITHFDIVKNMVKQRRYEEALGEVMPYLENGSIDYKILYCDILVQKGDCITAREILLKILQFDNFNVDAYIVLSALCLREKDFFSLATNLERLKNLQLNDKQIEVVANICAKSEDYELAIDFYQKILKNDEFNTKILLFVSLCYYNLKNYKEAQYYIGRAIWIDMDNPILKIFSQIIDSKIQKNVQISTSLPYQVGQDILDNIMESIDSNFDQVFCTSLTLARDIEWALTLKNTTIMQKITQNLAKSSKKELIKFYQKQLLTTRLSVNQKFFLTKYALFYGRLKTINVTVSLVYKSFNLKIPKQMQNNQTLKAGYCGAVSFAEINNLDINLDKVNSKLMASDLIINSGDFTENLISCLYFCENNQILEQACIYFDMPKIKVVEAIKCLNLL